MAQVGDVEVHVRPKLSIERLRRVAYADYRGSARVTGGPGTGKTVAALHRAKDLAGGVLAQASWGDSGAVEEPLQDQYRRSRSTRG